MAQLAVQEIPANGGELTVTENAAAVAGDNFANDGRTLVIVRFGAAPSGNVVIEGVPAGDSGRDGEVTVTAGANETHVRGPFKGRNFGAFIDLTYPSGVTDIDIGLVSMGTG